MRGYQRVRLRFSARRGVLREFQRGEVLALIEGGVGGIVSGRGHDRGDVLLDHRGPRPGGPGGPRFLRRRRALRHRRLRNHG